MSRLASYGLALASGVVTAAAFPFVLPWAPAVEAGGAALDLLAFVGLVPLLLAVEGRTPKAAFGRGWLAGVAFFALTLYWINVAMTTFGGLPHAVSVPVLGLLVAYCALYWGAAMAVAVKIRRELGWPLWAVLPPVWVAAELARNYLLSGFPWANLGYALARTPLLLQLASLGGVYLVAGLVVLVNGGLFALLRWWRAGRPAAGRRRALFPAAVAGAALILSAGWGAFRLSVLAAADEGASRLDVAVVQGNIDQKIKNARGRHVRFILESYLPQSREAVDAGAELVVWPEAAYPEALSPDWTSLRPVGTLAILEGRHDAHYLLSGTTLRWEGRRPILTNSAFLVNGRLDLLGRYDKVHLVPFGEYVPFEGILPIDKLVPDLGTLRPGAGLRSLELEAGGRTVKVGDLICYDGIFPELGRTYGAEPVDLLVNQTNDAWYGFSSAPHQFLRIVAVRAVENGRWVVRAANTGISAFIDAAGRVHDATGLGLVDSDSAVLDGTDRVPPERIRREVPLLEGRTPYAVMGDVFAWASLAFAAGVFGLAAVRGRRRRRAAARGADAHGGSEPDAAEAPEGRGSGADA